MRPGLEARLADLPSRVHRGAYQAHPSRRVDIRKAEGRHRPLGVAALEDQMVQQAVATILTQSYAEDCRGFADGCRPGRRPHHALEALSGALTRTRVHDGRDGDRRGCCDHLAHAWLVTCLPPRVADPRVLRLIQRWRRAGVSEEGPWWETTGGTAGGGGYSSYNLANVFFQGWDRPDVAPRGR
jgi:RNA-directed DNA polymerase